MIWLICISIYKVSIGMQRYVGFPKGELKVYLRSQLLHLSYGGVQLKKASRKLTFLSSVILLFIMIFTMTGCSERSAKSNEKTDVQSAFEQVVSKGYQGTEEQWLASLVGEQANQEIRGQTAFSLAKEQGYSGNFSEWCKILTGEEESDETKTAYQIMQEHGYSGSLANYLTGLSKNPENLGKSENGAQKTAYEEALENGYSGSYIEWLIFLVG